MNYKDIENKYINAEIKGHYRFENALEIQKVLGFDLRKIKGFKALSIEDKELAERLICNFINQFGLEAREGLIITKITREKGQFTVYYGDSYSYLYDNGLVG